MNTNKRMSLLQLQRQLNEQMQCPAGKNQVVVLSRLRTNGRIKKEAPRVCLDCKIRSTLGWRKRVHQDFIQKVCCGDHKRMCEAYTKFMARQRNPFMHL